MKQPTKTIPSIVIILVVIVFVYVIAKSGVFASKTATIVDVSNETEVLELISPAARFEWRYEKGTEDLDGLPKTIVFLDTTYENDKVVPIRVEEVQGSCNAIDPASDDKDMVSGTTKIQCYAAGFGEFYKVIKGVDSYQVVRKHIEEGDPEVAPVDFKYEKVADVPLFQ